MKYRHAKFFAIFFIFLFFKQNLAFADLVKDEVFTVKNILVDVSSVSSVKAKEIALLEAQEQGFNILMKKILLKGEYAKILNNIDTEQILEFVQEIEIESEKTSSLSYIGSILVKFKKDTILNFLKKNKIKFSITKSKPLLILPIFKFGGVTYLWDDKNIWKDLWSETSNDAGLIPIKASAGKFSDFIYINPNQALKKNLKNLKKIADSHNSTGILLAILKKKFNRDKSKVILLLDLSIYRFDGDKTNNFEDMIEADIEEYSDDLLKQAKLKVENFVNNQWKVKNILSTSINYIRLKINYDSLQEWVEIRDLVKNISIINNYKIEKFSKNFVIVYLLFSGDYNQLKVALKQSDLEFNINEKSITLTK